MQHPHLPWKQIVEKYPDQWVSLAEIEKDINGLVRSATVTAFAPDLKSLTRLLKKTHQPTDRFEYTGTIKNFLGFARWTIEDIDDAASTAK